MSNASWTIKALEEHLLIGSTLVEGSTLTESQARSVLAGRTVSGHPVREVRELTNYRAATEWLMDQLRVSHYLSLDLILGYHAHLMQGITDDAGRFKTHSNYTIRSDGTRFDYRQPSQVRDEMMTWTARFNESADDAIGTGTQLYAQFQAIHPFADGNGRIGRVLLAWYLHRERAGAFRFYASDKIEHLRAIEASDLGDMQPLEAFVRARAIP